MHTERENLDIVFRRTTPESILKNIHTIYELSQSPEFILNARMYSKEAYEHFSPMNMSECSIDEINMRYSAFAESIKGKSIFDLLVLYAEKVLEDRSDAPVCKIESCLGWNSITRRLGQDLFITAWYAWKDIQQKSISVDMTFAWPAIIETDDRKLNSIMKRGMAENHFHLHGSTQSFSLSWICLMNHPDYIQKYFCEKNIFDINLNYNISRGTIDNVLSIRERLLYASVIRAILFNRCMELNNSIKQSTGCLQFQCFEKLPLVSTAKKQIEALRFMYGQKFCQLGTDTQCLDYAICRWNYRVDEMGNNRVLAGERNFLYQCFRFIFSKKFSLYEETLFYLYTVIKSNFRSELIQNNRRVGFANFSAYQDRKNKLFKNFDEYMAEAQRLAVCSSIEENYLMSLEARIMPLRSADKLKEAVEKIDKFIFFAANNQKMPYYYVIHFPKKSFSKNEFSDGKGMFWGIARNNFTRKNTEVTAKALVNYVRENIDKEQRIYGIDACSNEIGCRPEVFATDFRYIRSAMAIGQKNTSQTFYERSWEKFGITYHVGEDFLDIVDGLRAVDETLRFLPMEKGDRLGHALVLGIDAENYYKYKKNVIFLSKQDYLDNLVWLIYSSPEMNIVINADHYSAMKKKARELLDEIFNVDFINTNGITNVLDAYYYSWQLRGDHPDLYKLGKYNRPWNMDYDEYKMSMIGGMELERYRKTPIVAQLYALYQFDPNVKMMGLKTEKVEITPWWVEMTERFQREMRAKVYRRQIGIECNPTSNILIGSFDRYDQHPILMFNNYHLIKDNEPNMLVSINTDDLGVFDTSLKNEYALMFASISRTRHLQQNYEDDDIYEYIDYLRQNGLNMVFKNIKK